jgi:UDP-N-acetylglucosamine 4-epimerase
VIPAALLEIEAKVRAREPHWLVTGAAGFIGSHLLESLPRAGQRVTTTVNFTRVRELVGGDAWSRHRFIDGDIADPAACRLACEGAELVLY